MTKPQNAKRGRPAKPRKPRRPVRSAAQKILRGIDDAVSSVTHARRVQPVRAARAYVSIGSMAPATGCPQRRTASHGGEIVSNTELIVTNLVMPGNSSFNVNWVLPLQPADPGTFSWLAPIASSYQSYTVNKCKMWYIPACGTSYEGQVLFFPSYALNIGVPTTELQMMNNKDAHPHVVWDGCTFEFDVAAMNQNGKHRTRYGTSAGDPNLYEFVKLFIGTVGAGTNSQGKTIGRIYLEYEFEFYEPINATLVSNYPTGNSFYAISGPQTFSSTVAAPLIANLIYDPLDFQAQATYNGRPSGWLPDPGFWKVIVNVTMENTANEATTYTMYIELLGTLKANSLVTSKAVPGVTNNFTNITTQFIFQVTDYVSDMRVMVVATGATGTLTAQNGTIIFTPA